MIIKNRSDFEKYILESLGAPVIKINITQQQLENVIDDSINYFVNYHYEGCVRMFLQQIITPSIVRVTDNKLNADGISGCKITGLTSGATSYVCGKFPGDHRTDSINGTIYCERTTGEFLPGEQIDINGKQYTVINSPKAFQKGIIDEQKIKMPDWIIGVVNIVPSSQALSSQNLFDLQYQLRLNDFNATQLTTQSLIYFEQAMEHIDLLNYELTAKPNFEFNQYDGYLYPHTNWNYDFCVGDYMLIECYRTVDIDGAGKFFNQIWLKRYAVALAKKQWASNLRKYSNVQLPGGVTFNSDQMYQEAITEIEKLENELQGFSWPTAFILG